MVLLAAAVAHAAPELEGTWRLEWVAVNQVRIPILGNTLVSTRQVSLGKVRRLPDGSYQQTHQACEISATSDSSFTSTQFPPGFLRALPAKTYLLTMSPTANGWTLQADTGPLAIGWRGDGPMPVTAEDPAVFDWDDDGAPGGTVTVRAPLFGSVDVYVVQHSRGQFEGAVTEVDGVATAIRGSFRLADFAQATIGASNRLFHTTPRATFRPELSTVVMERVAADSTCAELAR